MKNMIKRIWGVFFKPPRRLKTKQMIMFEDNIILRNSLFPIEREKRMRAALKHPKYSTHYYNKTEKEVNDDSIPTQENRETVAVGLRS